MATPSSSQTISSERKMVPELRPMMALDLFKAAIKGNSDELIIRLGLQPEILVTIGDPDSSRSRDRSIQSDLRSATRFGDTLLHLLVTHRHNEIALQVFERDMSLLKAQNKMLETPLYCAAKVGNNEVIEKLIRINSVVVKNALNETNQNGDTAMHVAVNNGCEDVVRVLMNFDSELAYKVNNERLTPFNIAVVKFDKFFYTNVVPTMLDVDPNLACTQFLDGRFPVHVAASVCNMDVLGYLFSEHPDFAELLDTRGRNVFHHAAEQGHSDVVRYAFRIISVEVIERLYDARDYEGKTPQHIAYMKGDISLSHMIDSLGETIRNKQDWTAAGLNRRMQLSIWERNFTKVEIRTDNNMWEKLQVIGLGSVLITTVAFAACFTVPGGYNQDNGRPVLGRRYMFWAYILANTFAFIQGFISLFALLLNALITMPPRVIEFAVLFFLLAASSLVVAFGLGLYVSLAPVCLPIAIILLVVTLVLASPALLLVLITDRFIAMVVRMLERKRTIVVGYMVPLLLVFGLASLSLLYSLSF